MPHPERAGHGWLESVAPGGLRGRVSGAYGEGGWSHARQR
jgi:hypothetical protein